jgi:hypothetical protein
MIDQEARKHQKAVERAHRAWVEARDMEANALARRAETAKVKGAHASLENQGRAISADLNWRRAQDATRAAEVELDTALHGAELYGDEPHARAVDLACIVADVSALVEAAAELRRQATEAEQKAAARLADARGAREALAVTRTAAGLPPPALVPVPPSGIQGTNMSPGHQLIAIKSALANPPRVARNAEVIRMLEGELRSIAASVEAKERARAAEERERAEQRAARAADDERRAKARAAEAEKARREAAKEQLERDTLVSAGMARLGVAS